VNRWVGTIAMVCVLFAATPEEAHARPATPKAAPTSKLPKPRHSKQPEVLPEAPIDPWREKPRYGAPWKRPSADPKLRGKPIGGTTFEFFFWLWMVPIGVGVGGLILERRARRRGPDWEVRPSTNSTTTIQREILP
jgi:hypothetical protein